MTRATSTPDTIATIRGDIRAAGLRATGARISVLTVLRQQGRPMSHGEVAELLQDQTWDKATVYRNLIDLAGAGLLRRAVLGGTVWRFEEVDDSAHDSHTHAHFVCVKCGIVECLPEDAVTLSPASLAATPGVEVQLRGECGDCAPA